MAELRSCLELAGYGDVKTYIQSGNIAFNAPEARVGPDAGVAAHAEQLTGLISKNFGLTVPVVIRTAEQIAAVIADNPFPEAEAEPKFLLVYFCSEPFAADALTEFDHDKYQPDRLATVGGAGVAGPEVTRSEVYVAYSEGMSKSKLTNVVLDRTLQLSTTARNWNTVLKLHELATG